MRTLARQKPGYGYRRLHAILTQRCQALSIMRLYHLSGGEGFAMRRLKTKTAELTGRHILGWCEEKKIILVHIQPGKPMKNGHAESFNGQFRDECLNARWFHTLADANQKIAFWRNEYNREQSGYRTRNEFSKQIENSLRMDEIFEAGENVSSSRDKEASLYERRRLPLDDPIG